MKRINAVTVAAFVIALIGLAGVFFYGPWPYVTGAQEPHFFLAKLAMVAGLGLGAVGSALARRENRKERADERYFRAREREAEEWQNRDRWGEVILPWK